jgi:hypothetical protein
MGLGLRLKKVFAKFGQNLVGLIQRHQLAFLIIAAVITTLILTTISIYIYVLSGAINIDLSRPGYESVRQDTSDESSGVDPFSSSGKIDDEVRTNFLHRLEVIQNNTKQMNDFGGDSLSDKSLDLE